MSVLLRVSKCGNNEVLGSWKKRLVGASEAQRPVHRGSAPDRHNL